MLAAGTLKNLLFVGPETDDMLLGGEALLHRDIDMIAFSGPLTTVERR
jgi:hypothetical protein